MGRSSALCVQIGPQNSSRGVSLFQRSRLDDNDADDVKPSLRVIGGFSSETKAMQGTHSIPLGGRSLLAFSPHQEPVPQQQDATATASTPPRTKERHQEL